MKWKTCSVEADGGISKSRNAEAAL